VATAIVVDVLGGVIFDFDVNTVYRRVFRKLDQMVAEMEELRGLRIQDSLVNARVKAPR
jgi:hypothetical protein